MPDKFFIPISFVVLLLILILVGWLVLDFLPPLLSISVCLFILLFMLLHSLVINTANYKEAKQLYSSGADIYVNGLPVYNFNLDGIDESTYTITISDDKDKIYLKSN